MIDEILDDIIDGTEEITVGGLEIVRDVKDTVVNVISDIFDSIF